MIKNHFFKDNASSSSTKNIKKKQINILNIDISNNKKDLKSSNKKCMNSSASHKNSKNSKTIFGCKNSQVKSRITSQNYGNNLRALSKKIGDTFSNNYNSTSNNNNAINNNSNYNNGNN